MFFRKFSLKASQAVGSGPAFLIAVAVTVLWLAAGPYFHFSDA